MKTMDMIADAIETKHRQLCLARKGLYKVIIKSIVVKVQPEQTQEEVEEIANKNLDEIIASAVAVHRLKLELDEMQKAADKFASDEQAKFFSNLFFTKNDKEK